jgi:PAS domain S-box-containing protein
MPIDWNETKTGWLRWNDSLQARMMLATGLVLVISISIFSFINYLQTRNQAVSQAENRLAVVSEQLAQNFGQAANRLVDRSRAQSRDSIWTAWISSPQNMLAKQQVMQAISEQRDASEWPVTLLADKNLAPISIIGDSSAFWANRWSTAPLRAMLEDMKAGIGEWISRDSSLYYPVVVVLSSANGSAARYLIRWRQQVTSEEAIAQFAALLGTGISFQVGNADGRWWTDLRQVEKVDKQTATRELAIQREVPYTTWQMRISIDRQTIIQKVLGNTYWLLAGGLILMILGVFAAGWIGRKITEPLYQLQAAAETAAAGDYDIVVPTNRSDEIGRLGRSFENLLIKVRDQHRLQEEQVTLRTAQLEEKILELQASEERFRGLLESAPDATIIVDQQGRILIINRQAETLFGYTREELLNASVEQLIPAAQRRTHESHRAGYFADPKVRAMGVGLELYALRRNGSSFPVEISLSPMRTPTGMLVTAAVRDISERKRIEESIRQVNKELESFTYSVSHDLRAPLRIIDGYADILLEDYSSQLNSEGVRVLGTIKRNARRMGQLIDDLLNMSRLGRRELEKSLVDMNRMVNRVINETKPRESACVVHVDQLEPGHCDESLIEQVWINLLSNAFKYSSQTETPTVSITCQTTPSEVIYSVSDNGVGFDMKYADKLFGVFQRLHKVTEFEGTGIGLALAQRIVNRHGGRIWADASPGIGATFRFSLPLRHTANQKK